MKRRTGRLGIAGLVLLAILLSLFPANGSWRSAHGAPDMNTRTKVLVGQLRQRVDDLRTVQNLHDPSVKNIADAMDTLTKTLEGMTFEYGGTGGTGPTGETAYYPKSGGKKIYITDRFYDSNLHFGAAQGDDLSVQQMSILLHEAVHADQNLQMKTVSLVKSLLPDVGDQAEGEAYMVQYIMFRALGGQANMAEAGVILDGLQKNRVIANDSPSSLERFEAALGILDGLSTIDGGPQRAVQRLASIKASLPNGGTGLMFRLQFRLMDDQGRPVVGYWPVNLRITRAARFAGKLHVTTQYSGSNGFITGYANWLDLLREYPLDTEFELYMQDQSGAILSLTRFTGESMFMKPRVQDKPGFFTIDLGSKSIASFVGLKKASSKPPLKLNTVGPNGSIPANRITVGLATQRGLSREEDKVITRPAGYTGPLSTSAWASVDDSTRNRSYQIRRFAVADGGEVTMDFTPMPPLADGPLATPGMTEQQKDARLAALISKAESLFKQALDGGGFVSGTSTYTLEEYHTRTLELDGIGSLLYGSPSRQSSWESMLKRQQDEAYTRVQGYYTYLSNKLQAKRAVENALLSSGVSARDYMVSSPDSRGSYAFSSNTLDSMDNTINRAKTEADNAIRIYTDYVSRMNEYFNDAELFKAFSRYRDGVLYLPTNRTSSWWAYGDTTLASTVDMSGLSERAEDLEKMIEGREIIIRNLVRERNRILQQQADKLTAEAQAAGQSAQNAADALNRAAAALPRLEANRDVFSKYSAFAIVSSYIDVNSRLSAYLSWRSGQTQAQVGWGTNYTVTTLHDDVNNLLRLLPDLAGLVGGDASAVEPALRDLSHAEWSLKTRLTALVKSTQVVKNLHERAIAHSQEVSQVADWLSLAAGSSLESRRAQLAARWETASSYFPYPNGDLFSQAIAQLPAQVAKLSGDVPTATPPITPPQQQPPVATPPTTQGEPPITLSVNSRAVAGDVPPKLIQGRTMVPIRFVAEALQATVEWRAHDRTVLITSPGKSAVQVPTGNGTLRVVVDGREVKSDVPPLLIDGRTMVPVRFVAEAMGAEVGWDGPTRHVRITTKPGQSGTQTQVPVSTTPVTTPASTGDTISSVAWDEWTVRLSGSQDIKTKQDSAWVISSDTLTYSQRGNGFYWQDFVVTRKDYDVSDILVTFEAMGTHRTSQGYVGSLVVFCKPGDMGSGPPPNALGVGAWYGWEAARQDRGMLLFDYKQLSQKPVRFVDYGDSTYRSYSIRIKSGKMTVTTPDGVFSVDVTDAKPGLRLPLLVALRQYDSGKPFSLSIQNLRIVERPQ